MRVSRPDGDGGGRGRAQGQAAVSGGGGGSGRRGGLLGKRRSSRVELPERSDPRDREPGPVQEIVQVTGSDPQIQAQRWF